MVEHTLTTAGTPTRVSSTTCASFVFLESHVYYWLRQIRRSCHSSVESLCTSYMRGVGKGARVSTCTFFRCGEGASSKLRCTQNRTERIALWNSVQNVGARVSCGFCRGITLTCCTRVGVACEIWLQYPYKAFTCVVHRYHRRRLGLRDGGMGSWTERVSR